MQYSPVVTLSSVVLMHLRSQLQACTDLHLRGLCLHTHRVHLVYRVVPVSLGGQVTGDQLEAEVPPGVQGHQEIRVQLEVLVTEDHEDHR